jgi:hypothetical protein
MGSFSNWKRRFRLVNLVPPSRPALPAPAAFVPVTVRVVEEAAGEAPIEADLPNGIRLRIPTSDARLVCRVVRDVARARTQSGDTLRSASLIRSGSFSTPDRLTFRKGFDALPVLVITAFAQDPSSCHLFLFVNRRRDRLKIL